TSFRKRHGRNRCHYSRLLQPTQHKYTILNPFVTLSAVEGSRLSMKEQQTHNNTNPPTKTPKRVPKLRFAEFIGKWHSKTLGEIGNVAMCKRIMKDQTTEIGEIPFFKIGTFGKTPDAYISESLFQ